MDENGGFLDKALLDRMSKRGEWIGQNSAILVFHGIGKQKPLDTLDSFVRGLLEAYLKAGFEKQGFRLTHKLGQYKNPDGSNGYENFIRIEYHYDKEHSPYYLDCYEYYWAPETENQVSWKDTQQWINALVFGANKFYKKEENKRLGERYEDESIFFPNGKFSPIRYKLMLIFSVVLLPLMSLIRYLPIIGKMIYRPENRSSLVINYIGDIIAYNSPDPKNKFFKIRRKIQVGAYKAIRHLIEAQEEGTPKYNNIVIAAHSLGTQIAFDGLNSIDHRVALKDLKREDIEIKDLISGFVTFGSHLDKAAFFFREQTEDELYIKAQMRQHFYAFKQREKEENPNIFRVENGLKSEISSIDWRNYYDKNDAVSGHLDYYDQVENIHCDYKNQNKNCKDYSWIAYLFTHTMYWQDSRIYTDIIVRYLNRKGETS